MVAFEKPSLSFFFLFLVFSIMKNIVALLHRLLDIGFNKMLDFTIDISGR